MQDTNRLLSIPDSPLLTTQPQAPVADTPAPAHAPVGTLHPTGNGSRFRIPADIISRTCEGLPEEQRVLIRWAAGYCRSRDLTPEDFGALLRQPGTDRPYSGDSIYQAFSGRRTEPGSLDRLCDAIQELRRQSEETLPRTSIPFIQTSQTKAIWDLCDRAYRKKRVSFLIGPTQIGKTLSLSKYQEAHNHGRTILVRMPTGGGMCDLTKELTISLSIPSANRVQDLRRRIIRSFGPETLLIVDECHQCCLGSYGDRSLRSLELLREIHDRRQVPMIICGTYVLRQSLIHSPLLGQLWQRRDRVLTLGQVPPAADIASIEKSFGLSPAADKNIGIDITDPETDTTTRISGNPLRLQQQLISKESIGHYISLLEDAAESARETGSKLTWGRVILTHHQNQ